MSHTILAVDDEPAILKIVETILRRDGYDVCCANSGEQAEAMFRNRPTDLVITDIRMPGMDGLELVKVIKSLDPDVQVIVLTGHASLDLAVEAFKDHNVFDFLAKPQSRDTLLRSVTKALEHRFLLKHNRELINQLKERQNYLEDQNKKLIETRNALQGSQKRYQELYDNAPAAYLTLDAEGVVLEANKMAGELFGTSIRKLLNQPFQALMHDSSRDSYAVFRQLTGHSKPHSCEMTLLRSDGSAFESRFEAKSITCQQSGRHHIHVALTDMTDYKQLQAQIIENRKLEAITTLAGGVAHQFNNALAGLVGYVELMQMDLKKKGHQSPHAEAVFQLTERMAHLTRQLLAYAEGGQYAPKRLKVTELVELCVNLMRNKIPEAIRLETSLPTRVGRIRADATQMQMVLLALVQNAAEAITGKGRIVVSAHNADISAGQVKAHPKGRIGRFVCLGIEDDGCGMHESTQKKIFDPFFTTKTIGRGLGLSAVYGIVSNHGGWIEVASTAGQGARVAIYLERVEKKKAAAAERNQEISNGEGATVLVIEDEKPLMRATCQRLQRMNYQTLEAGTGQQALDLLGSHKGPLDAVLMDMRLPDIKGDALYYKLTAIRPGLPVLLCSGYSIDDPVRRLLKDGARGFLQKPFTLSRLTEKLDQIIASRKAGPPDAVDYEAPDTERHGNYRLEPIDRE